MLMWACLVKQKLTRVQPVLKQDRVLTIVKVTTLVLILIINIIVRRIAEIAITLIRK